MNNNEVKEFPVFVVREQKREKVAAAFSALLGRCKNAYSALKGMPDIGEVPCDLSLCTADRFNAYINQAIDRIKGEIVLTQATKADAIAEWEKVRSEALEKVGAISRFLAAYPQAKTEVKESSVECLNSLDVINDLSKEIVPDGCKQHYELICEAAEVLGRLYTYQNENDVPLLGVSFLRFVDDPEGLAKLWLHSKEMMEFIDLQNKPSGVRMDNGQTIADANAEHRQKMLQQAAEREQLRKDFLERQATGTSEEIQLFAIPIH